ALGDAVSHAGFCYGDSSWVGFLELAQAVSTGVQYGPMMAQITGQAGKRDGGELQAYFAFKALADRPNLVRVPDTVIGFKVKDKAGAKKLFDHVVMAAKHLGEAAPKLQGRVSTKKLIGGDFVVLDL